MDYADPMPPRPSRTPERSRTRFDLLLAVRHTSQSAPNRFERRGETSGARLEQRKARRRLQSRTGEFAGVGDKAKLLAAHDSWPRAFDAAEVPREFCELRRVGIWTDGFAVGVEEEAARVGRMNSGNPLARFIGFGFRLQAARPRLLMPFALPSPRCPSV